MFSRAQISRTVGEYPYSALYSLIKRSTACFLFLLLSDMAAASYGFFHYIIYF